MRRKDIWPETAGDLARRTRAEEEEEKKGGEIEPRPDCSHFVQLTENIDFTSEIEQGIYLDKLEKVLDISFEFMEEMPGEIVEEQVNVGVMVVESLSRHKQVGAT